MLHFYLLKWSVFDHRKKRSKTPSHALISPYLGHDTTPTLKLAQIAF